MRRSLPTSTAPTLRDVPVGGTQRFMVEIGPCQADLLGHRAVPVFSRSDAALGSPGKVVKERGRRNDASRQRRPQDSQSRRLSPCTITGSGSPHASHVRRCNSKFCFASSTNRCSSSQHSTFTPRLAPMIAVEPIPPNGSTKRHRGPAGRLESVVEDPLRQPAVAIFAGWDRSGTISPFQLSS